MANKIKYKELSDLEKLQKQWKKLSGLHTREEWSSAIIRAATAAEIAANFAIRKEFEESNLDPIFIDHLLRWANGLSGKLDRLLIPLSTSDSKKNKNIRQLKILAEKVNLKRNAIAHQGEFCNETEAEEHIENAKEFIINLVGIYDKKFTLNKKKTPKKSQKATK